MAASASLGGLGIDPLSLQDFKLDPEVAGSDYCYSPREPPPDEQYHQQLPAQSGVADREEQEKALPVEELPMDDWVKPLSRPSIMTQMIWREMDKADQRRSFDGNQGSDLRRGTIFVHRRTSSMGRASIIGRKVVEEVGEKGNTGPSLDLLQIARSHFGSWSAVKKTVLMVTWDVINPLGFFRTNWDLMIILLLVYIALVIPFLVGFGVTLLSDKGLGAWEHVVDSIFLLDVLLNFRTGIVSYKGHNVVKERRQIVVTYIKGWFLPDLISSFPYELLLISPDYVGLVKAARLLKLARMLRLAKLMTAIRTSHVMKSLQNRIGPGRLQMIGSCLAALTLAHWVACMFHFISMEKMKDGKVETWIEIKNLQDASNVERYVTAFYWTMSTMGTVGYGDVLPGNNDEKIFSMASILLGCTVFAYFMTSMGRILGSMHMAQRAIAAKMKLLDRFFAQRKVPRHLANRIKAFLTATEERHLAMQDTKLLEELSHPLRTEMTLFLYGNLVQKIRWFNGKDDVFIAAIIPKLNVEYFAPGDIVVRQGDPGGIIYFITEGWAEVRLYLRDSQPTHDDDASVHISKADSFTATAAAKEPPRHSGIEGNIRGNPYQHLQDNLRHDAASSGDAPALPGDHWQNLAHHGLGPRYVVMGTLAAGDHFGEYSMLLGEQRAATVVAVDNCELYSLSRASLQQLLEVWPEINKEFEAMLKAYTTQPNDQPAPFSRRRESTASSFNMTPRHSLTTMPGIWAQQHSSYGGGGLAHPCSSPSMQGGRGCSKSLSEGPRLSGTGSLARGAAASGLAVGGVEGTDFLPAGRYVCASFTEGFTGTERLLNHTRASTLQQDQNAFTEGLCTSAGPFHERVVRGDRVSILQQEGLRAAGS